MKKKIVFISAMFLLMILAFFNCGQVQASTIETDNGFYYELKDDNTYSIVAYAGISPDVTVPSTFKDKPVTEIGKRAFCYETYKKYSPDGEYKCAPNTIFLPDTITTIQDEAFYWLSSLKKINIPNSVQNIGTAPFICCYNMEKFEISDDHPYFTLEDGILYNKDKTKVIELIFLNNNSIVVPDSVTIIGERAYALDFHDIRGQIKEVTLGKNVKVIGVAAFDYSSITEITIPKSVEKIEKLVFNNSDLTKCIIEEGSSVEIDVAVFPFTLKELDISENVTNLDNIGFTGFPGLTIYAVEGSYAEEVAKKNNVNFVAKHFETGDVTKDGKITTSDARAVLLNYIGANSFTKTQLQLADVNKDGKINTKDARQILLYYIGKINKFED